MSFLYLYIANLHLILPPKPQPHTVPTRPPQPLPTLESPTPKQFALIFEAKRGDTTDASMIAPVFRYRLIARRKWGEVIAMVATMHPAFQDSQLQRIRCAMNREGFFPHFCLSSSVPLILSSFLRNCRCVSSSALTIFLITHVTFQFRIPWEEAPSAGSPQHTRHIIQARRGIDCRREALVL